MMVLMMLNSARQPGLLWFRLNLKVETIVLQVLAGYYYIIIKTVMENECGKSVPTRGPLTIYHLYHHCLVEVTLYMCGGSHLPLG